MTKTKHYAKHFKNSRGNIFSKQSRVNEWQLVTTEEIYVVLALVMLMGTAQKSSLRVYFSRNQIVDHLKFRTDLVEGLLVKYSVLHGVSGHHDGEGITKRLTKCHFPRRIPATEKKCKPTKWCVFYSKHNKRRKIVYYCKYCDVALQVDERFQANNTKKIYWSNVNYM